MNDEFNELFDIKEDEVEKPSVQITTQKIVIHTLIRTVILVVTAVATCVLLFIAAYDSQISLGVLALAIVVGWFTLMIIETVRLKKSNKIQLSQANSVLIGIAALMILMLIVGIK
ncbi:membrane protein YdbS with pleckstrin-like domain [Epilithonimonas hungarica]|uniref:hypothetical protein n=1 Tax=Epilithonimonas hungarica TaxID=454006 RepID=UPI00278902C1|nr:hypothetical protein [Epilithonimonas hungarica]MDP9955582.1 membrane protein YdbS with pleckstrin-like domain [Epilithonimonas hungarica]